MPEPKERREFLRIKMDQDVIVRMSTTEKTSIPVKVKLRNFSRSGAFLETEEPFEIGTLLEFVMKLPPSRLPTSIIARVIWRQEEDLCGIGIEFLEATPGNR